MEKFAPDIKYLFEPRAIAVIGASGKVGKIGHRIMHNIIEGGYQGQVIPVNPKGGEIMGCSVVKNVADVKTEIDVAVIVIPAPFVFDAVRSCAEAKVKFLSIITSGFSEVGNLDEERQIQKFARKHGMRILGPNIFGHFSAKVSLNATFGPTEIPKGHVSIITQSGALGIAMIGKTGVQNIGLSSIISVGNKSDLDEADLLEYLIDQQETQAILMYIEGIQNGARFVQALKKATLVKPVVVIKSGRSKKGAIAAASHTGSLAGADDVFDAIMHQCGVLRSESIQEALDWCKFLSESPIPKGENTVIITNGGGVGVLATDACEKYGVELYEDKSHMKEVFDPVTPDFGSTKNPVDITGGATADEYISALTAAMDDDQIHSVIGLYCETAAMTKEALTEMIQGTYEQYQQADKPVIFSVFGGEMTENSIADLNKNRIPVYRDVYESVSPLGALYRQRRHRMREIEYPPTPEIDFNSIQSIVDGARADSRSFLLAHEGQMLLNAVGLPGPQSHIAKSIDEAVDYAEQIGYPVVMKVVSRDILHKSDAGGVLLNLDDRNEVVDAYQTIIQSCRNYKSDARIDGIEVVEQIKPGTEVIIGGRQDKNFGPVIMFGLGGIYVEVMKDVAFRALPLSKLEARLMVEEIKSYPLLLGVRGEARKDIESIFEAIFKVGAIIQNCQDISDIEINPMIVYDRGKGIKAVDVRVLLSDTERN